MTFSKFKILPTMYYFSTKASKSTIDIKASKSIIDIIQVNTSPNSTIIQNQYFKSSNDYITNESVVTGIYYP